MGNKKTVNIEVEGASITILNQGEQDYLSLTDMLKAKEGDFSHWFPSSGLGTSTGSSSFPNW